MAKRSAKEFLALDDPPHKKLAMSWYVAGAGSPPQEAQS
jgi:hypothetical protein